jgi:hypothetical protein
VDTELCPPWFPSLLWHILRKKDWVNYPPVDEPTRDILVALSAFHMSYAAGEAGIEVRRTAAADMVNASTRLLELGTEFIPAGA